MNQRQEEQKRKLPMKIKECEALLQQTKTKFELYFRGLEEKPPYREKIQIETMTREIFTSAIQIKGLDAATKFKIQALKTKFTTLKNLWDRRLREIEQGKFIIPKRAEQDKKFRS